VILATLVAALLMPVLSTLIPAVTLRLTVASVSKIAVAGVFVAITASLMPARQIARLDPVSAFQSGG
jgi:ABC-type antimicrobial peptide transport system permease subunit